MQSLSATPCAYSKDEWMNEWMSIASRCTRTTPHHELQSIRPHLRRRNSQAFELFVDVTTTNSANKTAYITAAADVANGRRTKHEDRATDRHHLTYALRASDNVSITLDEGYHDRVHRRRPGSTYYAYCLQPSTQATGERVLQNSN